MQKSFPQCSPLPSFHPSIHLLSYLHVIKMTSSNMFFPLFCLFVLSLWSFRVMSKQKCFPTHLLSQTIRSYKDKGLSLTASCQVISLSFLSVLESISSLCILSHHSLCRLSLSFPLFILLSFIPLSLSVSISLPFTNQYAGQQAVWQIVCCELHEKPLSIISVRYWIQSVVFSRVKWKDWGVQNVRWGESERRPVVHFSPFCDGTATSRLSQKHCCFGCFHNSR